MCTLLILKDLHINYPEVPNNDTKLKKKASEILSPVRNKAKEYSLLCI